MLVSRSGDSSTSSLFFFLARVFSGYWESSIIFPVLSGRCLRGLYLTLCFMNEACIFFAGNLDLYSTITDSCLISQQAGHEELERGIHPTAHHFQGTCMFCTQVDRVVGVSQYMLNNRKMKR
jgi:hypothetical protein